MTEKHSDIYTLHRYFIWADRMRVHFEEALNERTGKSKKHAEIDQFLYMSYWYGGMYVVVEGWNALGLSDLKIQKLLDVPNVNIMSKSEFPSNVDLLRRYRNGAFHFQKEYFDNRFRFFWQDDDTVKWIRDLRAAYSNFFLSCLSPKGAVAEDSTTCPNSYCAEKTGAVVFESKIVD